MFNFLSRINPAVVEFCKSITVANDPSNRNDHTCGVKKFHITVFQQSGDIFLHMFMDILLGVY
jgi:hypothetical protein